MWEKFIIGKRQKLFWIRICLQWDDRYLVGIQFTFWEKVFLVVSFRFKVTHVVHVDIKDGKDKDGKDNRNVISKISMLSDEATDKDAGRSYISVATWLILTNWSQLSCLVKISTNRAQWACRTKVSMVWKTHNNTTRWSPLSQSPLW